MLRTSALAAGIAMVTLLAAAGTGIGTAGTPALARRPVPHENPSTVPVEADPAAAFEWYLAAISQFTSWRFQEGRNLLIQLDRDNLPADIQGIVRETSDLVIKEGSILEAVDGWVRDASVLMDAGKTDAARQLLGQADVYVRRAAVLFDEVAGDFQGLARRSNVEALRPDAPQRRAYEQLQRAAARVKTLLLTYGAIGQDPQQVGAVTRLLPYKTSIELFAPSIVYPGRAFAVRGRVIEQAPVPSTGRLLTLRLDDQAVAALPLERLRHQFTVPAGTMSGLHLLTASVPAKGRYLGADVGKSIRVERAVPVVSLRGPKSVVVPGSLLLTGTARSQFGPVDRAVVQARVGRAVREVRTSETGEFRLTLELPGTLRLVGPEKMSVRLIPGEPWHAPVEVTRDLFIINPLNGAVSVALLLPIGGLLYTRTRRRRGPRELAGLVPVAEESVPARRAEPARVSLPGTVRDQLIAVYLAALRDVQAVTGSQMTPSTTLREFLWAVQPKLRGDAFKWMTTLAETALYSSRPITEESLEQIQRLKAQLKGELASGTA
ncbi:MAG: hypothetical protein AAB254_00135 [candidate division NC10 bacterium]